MVNWPDAEGICAACAFVSPAYTVFVIATFLIYYKY